MSEKEQVENFFEEYVFGFMCGDIERALHQECNFLCALGLVAYTEIMGSLVIGKLGKDGYSKQSFRKFLEYMGEKYLELDNSYDLYRRVRCGLVHEYFIKGPSTISTDTRAALETGIIIDEKTDVVYFYVPTYFQHFKEGAKRFLDELLQEDNSDMRRQFLEAIRGKVENIKKLKKTHEAVSGNASLAFKQGIDD